MTQNTIKSTDPSIRYSGQPDSVQVVDSDVSVVEWNGHHRLVVLLTHGQTIHRRRETDGGESAAHVAHVPHLKMSSRRIT